MTKEEKNKESEKKKTKKKTRKEQNTKRNKTKDRRYISHTRSLSTVYRRIARMKPSNSRSSPPNNKTTTPIDIVLSPVPRSNNTRPWPGHGNK